MNRDQVELTNEVFLEKLRRRILQVERQAILDCGPSEFWPDETIQALAEWRRQIKTIEDHSNEELVKHE